MNLNLESHRTQSTVGVDERDVRAATPVYQVPVVRLHGESASNDECCDSLVATTGLEARSHRARVVGEMIATGIMAMAAFVSRACARYKRHREAGETYATLARLNDLELLDLGFTREEIRSVIEESMGVAERTRIRAREA